MPGHYLSLVCVPCGEFRYRSTRPILPEEQNTLSPGDFERLGDQPHASGAGPATCYKCHAQLQLKRSLTLVPNPDGPPVAPEPAAPLPADSHAVQTLFAAVPGEEVRSMRDLPGDRILIATNRRIVVVNIEAIALSETPHA